MKFLLSILLAAFAIFVLAAIGYEGVPSASAWRDFFTEELGFAIIAFLIFFAISYGIVHGVASSRKKKALAPLMGRKLPWRIENDMDVFALVYKFQGTTSVKKERYRQMRALIEGGESLYFITGLATLHIHGTGEPAGEAVIGDLFLSDRRVFLRYGASEEKRSIPLKDIVSVVLNDKAVAFCTEETNVSLQPILSAPNAKEVYDIFAQAIRAAGVDLVTTVTENTEGEQDLGTQTQTTVDCPGCGAVINVTVGQTSQCEYCGRFVGASE